MTVAIIDDEVNNRSVIKSILNANCPFVEIVVEDGLINESIRKINLSRPELIFLDIELKNGTGFDIIKGLNYEPEIIFTTAYSQYAIDAIKVSAFDYILKPINDQELIDSVVRFMAKKEQAVNASNSASGFFSFATSEGKQSFNYNQIFYFESSGSYTYCVTDNKKIIFSKNIGEVEKEIPSSVFFRTHHSYIVNLYKIEKVKITRGGQINLSNGDFIPVSQRKTTQFIKLMKELK